ncbi:hypothetical protein [Fructobacillus ficulneus]|uniref:Yip1 domain-containing protein n=1 Tax=Fructobacillus ficulneus TaxID=157463 RepID=A0A0K8MH84_9LACO|nr:hypothetical protein [Fructobacillus ficulneus]GAO99926.1 hypothetical protein FFIC_260400 [Fructobacillus ficulneus]
MTSKREWQEYFELINERQPSEAETTAALERGEFQAEERHQEPQSPDRQNQSASADDVTYSRRQARQPETEPASENQAQPGFDSKQNDQVEPGQGQSTGHNAAAANASVEEFKKHAGNFFAWYKERVLHPTQYLEDEKPNKPFLFTSLALTLILSAASFWNIFRRFFTAGESAVKSTFGSYGTSQVQRVADKVLPSVFWNFLVIFAILFLAALAGLAIMTRNKVSFKDLFFKYLTWFPAASLFALAAFLYSFVASVPVSQLQSNPGAAGSSLGTSLFILTLLPLLGVGVTSLAAYYFIGKYQAQNEKFDYLWLQMFQIVVTAFVNYLGYVLIVSPMLKDFFSNLTSLFN